MNWLLYIPVAIASTVLFFYALAAVLPGRLSQLSAFTARSVASVVGLLICASYGTFASALLRVVGYGGLSQWTVARAFKWTMWLSCGVIFQVEESGRVEGSRRGGKEALKTRPAVFVSNHQTELDVAMLGAVMPEYCSVTAKKSLSYFPFLGWFMTLSKTVFIDRANSKVARAAFDGAASVMRDQKQSVFIFPEGTRSYSEKPDLLPFKKGAFHLAVQAQVPIVPVVCANYSHVLNMKKKQFNSGVIDVSVLPPIPTKGLTTADVDALTTRTRDAMMNELIRLSHVSGTENGEPLPRATRTGYESGSARQRKVENAI